jgi:poly-gamma-glutamate capsule biosynthesis protein CapA/YwtB (metallophosphatase superfamily)
MKTGTKILACALAALVLVLGALVVRNFMTGDSAPESSAAPGSAAPEETEPQTITATLGYFGDIVCHSGLNEDALQADGSYDYTPIFQGVEPYAAQADYALCTLETTFPGTGTYTGYPMFQSPEELAKGLSQLGFDLVNTASNHCMDSYQSGLIATLDVLDKYGLDHVGTYRTAEERQNNDGILLADVGGIQVAFISYTYGTNGIPVTGFEYAVNLLYKDYLTAFTEIDYEAIDRDIAAAKALEPDLIAFLIHWGAEYYTYPFDYQKELADHIFDQGVDMILGGHVHVPAPMELRQIQNPDGSTRQGYLCYCLGNLVSCQNDRYTDLTAAVNITLEKDLSTGEARVADAEYVPLYMVDLAEFGISDAGWRYRLWDLHGALDAYAAGDDWGVMNESLYQTMQAALEDLYTIFPRELDSRNKT